MKQNTKIKKLQKQTKRKTNKLFKIQFSNNGSKNLIHKV